MMSQITITNTLIQTTLAPNMRGRVISFYAIAFFGMQSLGRLLVGAISKWAGTRDTLIGKGFMALLIGGLHWRYLHKEKLKKGNKPSLTEKAYPNMPDLILITAG